MSPARGDTRIAIPTVRFSRARSQRRRPRQHDTPRHPIEHGHLLYADLDRNALTRPNLILASDTVEFTHVVIAFLRSSSAEGAYGFGLVYPRNNDG
jgi:hypothetical protein